MIEHSIAFKIISVMVQPILLFAAWLGFYPLFDLVVLEVDQVALLSPYMKSFLDDIKQLLGLLISLLVILKLWLVITKIKKEKK